MKSTIRKRVLLLLICALVLIVTVTPTIAYDRVIINSHDWHDVYSGMLFATLEGVPSNFLVSMKHASILLYSIPKSEKNIFIVSSKQQPFFVNYAPFLKSKGYSNPEELVTRDANLDLAKRVNTTKFIVIDPVYGYNAISVASYAAISNSYVIFANKRNIDSVTSLLDDKGATSVILFGQLDREVKDALARFNPETINKGDRFSNNLEMIDRYQRIKHSQQVILTNGEFLETSLLSGNNPVIFIGKENVPQIVQDYIKKSDFTVGILIGNELVGTAQFIRNQLGINVFVKFAQGERVPKGAISQVEDLDRFPMPSYSFKLKLYSMVYNRATRSLEVTYKNPQDLALYFKGTITINDNGVQKVTGDNDPIFLDKLGYKTVVYNVDSAGEPLLLEGKNLTAKLFTIFGEGPNSLEDALQATLKIDMVEVKDDTLVNITGLYYDKSRGKFFVLIKNLGDVDAYVQPEIVDLIVNDEPVTVASDHVLLIKKGKTTKIPVSIAMTDTDFKANPEIKVRAYYGEREISLVKMTEGRFALRFGGIALGEVAVYSLIIFLLVILFIFLGTKKKCKQCGHKNPRGRKRCEKCGAKL